MSDIQEIKCPKALLQRKILWCAKLNNFCPHQRHCHVRGRAILTEPAKTCEYREPKP